MLWLQAKILRGLKLTFKALEVVILGRALALAEDLVKNF